MTLDEIKVEALKIRLVEIVHEQFNQGNELEDLDSYTPIQITNGLGLYNNGVNIGGTIVLSLDTTHEMYMALKLVLTCSG